MFASKYRHLYILALSIYSYLNIKFTEGDELMSVSLPELLLFSMVLVLVLLVWEGSRVINLLTLPAGLNKPFYYSLIRLFLMSVAWVVILSMLSVLVQLMFGLTYSFLSFKLSLGFTFRVNLFLHCINAIVTYHSQLRVSQVAAEAAKKEGVIANYDALKRQVNPHFLFNSLNVLDSLIRINSDSASQFLERLSTVYRYLTLKEERDTVKLSEEIEFIRSYIYLMEVRFKDNLRVNLNIADDAMQLHIIPSSLQLVLENAIKHNEVSRSKPLTIQIQSEKDTIVILNDLQPKATDSPSSGIGLKNIQLRYEFLGLNNFVAFKEENQYKVVLPLIKET